MKLSLSHLSPILLVFLLLSCGPSRYGVDEFSQAFTVFRDAVYDLETESLLPVYNPTAQRCEEQNYFACVANALDLQRPAPERQNFARQALEMLDGPIKQKMSEFASRINSVATPTTALSDASNSVEDTGFRTKAIAVAGIAKDLQHNYDQIYVVYAQRFDLQRKRLEALSLDRTLQPAELQAHAEEVATLNKRVEELRAANKIKDKDLLQAFDDYRDTARVQQYRSKADSSDSTFPPLPNPGQAAAVSQPPAGILPMPK